MLIVRVDYDEFFSAEGIDDLILEYAKTGLNLALQTIPDDFLTRIRKTYFDFNTNSKVRFFLAFADGKAVGMGIYSLSVNNNSTQLIADVEALFVSKAYRKGGTGLKIIDRLREHAKRDGAKVIYFSCHADSAQERLFARKFTKVYSIFGEEL